MNAEITLTGLAKEITDAILYRQDAYLDEDLATSCMVVLCNYGDRWTPVRCLGGEWSGLKRDARRGHSGIPCCPNGHVLTESVHGRKCLGLIDAGEVFG